MPTSSKWILVAGFGSPFGTDRLGWDVLARLPAQTGVRVVCCDRTTLEWLDQAREVRHVYVVDALDFGGYPGEILVTAWNPNEPAPTLPLTQHGLSPLWGLHLAMTLGDLNCPVTIIGAQISPAQHSHDRWLPLAEHVITATLTALQTAIRSTQPHSLKRNL